MSQDTRPDDGTEAEQGLFPVHPKWFKIGFYLFFLVWLLYILGESLTYTRFEDTFFPYVVGIPVFLMILLQLLIIQYPEMVDRFVPRRPGADAESDGELQRRLEEATRSRGRPKKAREKYELVMFAWVFVLPFMMFYIGMGWTLILYVFTFTWYFVRDLKTATTVTLVVVAFVYVLFLHILDMIIWTGQWGLSDPFQYLGRFL